MSQEIQNAVYHPRDVYISTILTAFSCFLCSILGMHLFGGKLDIKTLHGDITTDRKNFDTLLWSMITVFQASFLLPNLCNDH